MKKVVVSSLLAALVASLVLQSCKNKNPKFVKFDNLVEYRIFDNGKGARLADGNIVLLHITKQVGDTVIFNSNLEDAEGVPNPVRKPQDAKDLTTVLMKLRAGDSLVLRFNADSVFGGQPPAFYKPGDDVLQTIKVLKIFKNEEEYTAYSKKKDESTISADSKEIEAYAAKNGLTLQKTPGGVYYQITRPGSGENATNGKELSMKYTGTTLDGTAFDSNIDPKFKHTDPLKFKLGMGMVIPGWDEGLTMFNKGAKGILVIPSALAYGRRGSPPAIKPNTILRFDVEVLDIADAKMPEQPKVPAAQAKTPEAQPKSN